MFASHQPRIAHWSQQSADNFADTLTFVQLTIQQALYTVPQAMRSVKRHGVASPFAWGFKATAIADIQSNKERLYDVALNTYHSHANPAVAERQLLNFFARLNGFGLVKGGFAAQLIFGLSGCLDTHNVTRLGYEPKYFKSWTFKKSKTPDKFLDIYVDLCDIAGGTEKLWDDWCTWVHARHPMHYRSPEHVSQLHLVALGIGD